MNDEEMIKIEAAKKFLEEQGLDMVVILAYSKDDNMQHVVSYGKTKKDCENAAKSASWAKVALGFPNVKQKACKHNWHVCPRCGKKEDERTFAEKCDKVLKTKFTPTQRAQALCAAGVIKESEIDKVAKRLAKKDKK